jgi:ferrous iron transport protein B
VTQAAPAIAISSAESSAQPPVVALAGNPNTGKTALFNALTGFHRHVANYPGVTVDLARGPIRRASRPLELLDLPGTYSLAAASPDEMILCNALCGRVAGQVRPAAILAIVDASNPLRNLYLVSQLLEVGLPVVIALNMMDIASARGIEIDVERLSQRLGVPVVPVIATQPKTVEPLIQALEAAVFADPPTSRVALPSALLDEAAKLCAATDGATTPSEALRILVDRGGHAQDQFVAQGGDLTLVEQSRDRLRAVGIDAAPAEVRARYAWINQMLAGVVNRTLPNGQSWTNRIDRLLTHRVGGALTLLVVLYGIFYAIYRGAAPLMGGVEWVFGQLGAYAAAILPNGAVQSLVKDGLIGGVGGVLTFLPQILLLFMFIAILEDCGYLARAAFMVDRLMRPLGLSGRAFIPLLSSFACAVPAIMGTRAIADRRERFITILMAPFMSCSARLPIYVLLIGAFVPARTWLGGWVRLDALVMLAIYLVGAICAIPLALLLRRTVFAGPSSGFLLELPTYKLPRPRTVFQRMYLAGRGFLVRAGTVILLVNLAIWTLGYFPHSAATRDAVEQQRASRGWDAQTTAAELNGAYLRDSFLGRLGHVLEPAIRPLGWDWRIGVAVLASFPARELVIASLGTVFNLGQDTGGPSSSLRQTIQHVTRADTGGPLFTLPVALSVMVFFALCAQCASTLVVMARETGSWTWPLASFLTMTALAYSAAWVVFHAAQALGS